MALSIIGTPAATAATSITLPTHAVGDIIVIAAYDAASVTPPTKPAAAGTVPAWSDIDANTGANTNAMRTVQFVATATNHTSGTWTMAGGAPFMAAIVIRGQSVSPIGGHGEAGSSGTTSIAPSVTMTNTGGSSMLLHFHGHIQSGTWPAAPAGYTRQAAVVSGINGLCLNTKDSTTSDGSIAQSTASSTNNGYRGATIEILVAGAAATGQFFSMF